MHKTPVLSEALSTGIEEVIERYRSTIKVTASERIEKLQLIVEQAKHLCSALSSLDSGTRHAINAPVTRSRYAVDPYILVPQLKMLIAQAEVARRCSPKPRRGPHRRESLWQLIADLGILWSADNPGLKGIVASKGERRGPMLDFVLRELKKANIRVQSKDALGKILYLRRARITERAKTVRQTKIITRKVGSVTLTTRE